MRALSGHPDSAQGAAESEPAERGRIRIAVTICPRTNSNFRGRRARHFGDCGLVSPPPSFCARPVKSFLDTSVLIAAFYGDHQHHEPSVRLFSGQKPSSGCTAAHCLADVYSVVTGMPGKNRASSDEALLFLCNVRERLTLVALNEKEYFGVLENAAAAGISGGICYDAIIAQCALKANAHSIFTWNARHFALLGAQIASRVRQPS